MNLSGFPLTSKMQISSRMTDEKLNRMIEQHFDRLWERMNVEDEIDPYTAIYKLETALSLITKAVDAMIDAADCVEGTMAADRINSLADNLEDFYSDILHLIRRLQEDA